MTESIWIWGGFTLFILLMLALDLGVFHRKAHAVSFREAMAWTGVWVALALLFNAGIYALRGPEPALEFLTGYLVEKSLSMDNVFVIMVIFGAFRIPREYQHKVLFWGILGALVFRIAFIAAGIALLETFHWMIYLFGGLLIVTAIRLVLKPGEQVQPKQNPVLRLLRRLVPMTEDLEGSRFVVRREGRLLATPLLAALLVVEATDIVFAVDSIPAILAISRDPFIVYTSNVFAILGLRSLYFAVAGSLLRFHFLHYGLAAILLFVGVKMLLVDVYEVPILLSLGMVAGILALSILASLAWPGREPAAGAEAAPNEAEPTPSAEELARH